MTVAAQVKQTLAALKGSEATLRIYSTQSQDQATQNVYTEALQTTQEIIHDLEQRLKTLEFEEPQYKGF